MFRSFVEWTEEHNQRGRKVVLFSTVGTYLFIMLLLFIAGLIWPTIITANIIQLFGIVTGLMLGIYGFYTGTTADKTGKIADKAADILLKNMEKIDKGK